MDRTETTGFSVAVVGHGALLAALTLGLATWGSRPPPSDAIEVSFVDEIGLVSASPRPADVPPEQGMAPETGPAEDAASTPDPRPAPSRVETPRRPPVPTKGSRERTLRPELGDILKGIGPDPSPSQPERPPVEMTGAERSSIRSLIAGALRPCRRQPLPADEAAVIRVDYRITLNRDGSVANVEFRRVINPNPELARYEQRMRDLALNVINECRRNFIQLATRYPQFYDVPGGWREFPYQFDPRARQ